MALNTQRQMQDLNFIEEEEKNQDALIPSAFLDAIVEIPSTPEPSLSTAPESFQVAGLSTPEVSDPIVDANTMPEVKKSSTLTGKEIAAQVEALSKELYPEPEEEDDYNFFESAAEETVKVGKNVVYGLGRKAILGSVEVAGQVALGAVQAVHAGTLGRAMEEAFKATFASVLTKDAQIMVSNLWGSTFKGDRYRKDKNLLDYVDIFDTHTELDKTYDLGQYSDFFSKTDEQGREIKGDYQKFVDYVFKTYDVPLEERSYLGRVLMTGAEFVVPLSVLSFGKRVHTVESQIKKYAAHRDKVSARLTEVKKEVTTSRYKGRLEKGLQAIDTKIDELQFHQRHYRAGAAAASLGSQANNLGVTSVMSRGMDPTVKSVLKQEGNMALMAATAMVSTEVLLENIGVKKEGATYALVPLLSALAGGMLGVTGLKRGLTTGKNLIQYAVKMNSDDPKRFDPMLRIRGYTQEAINKMSFKQKSEIAVTDPETLKMARQTGEVLAAIEKDDPEIYRKIVEGITYSNKLVEKFRNDLISDLENGVIKKEDFGYLDENLPMLLDQAVMLSGLHKLKDTLASNLSNSGLTMRTERFAAISELDKLTNFLQKQSDQIAMNLDNVEKKITGAAGAEGSFTSTIIKNVKEFTSDYKETGSLVKQELERLKSVKRHDIDPSNNKDFKEAMNDFFGEDSLNWHSIQEGYAKQGQKISLEEAIDIADQNKIAFGESQADLLQSVFKTMRAEVKKRYDDVEDFDIDIDDIFRDNRFASTLLESSDVLRVYQNELPGAVGRLEKLVKAGRMQGLSRIRNAAESETEHIKDLIHMDLEHDSALGLQRNVEERQEYHKILNEEISEKGYTQVIKDLEETLINKQVTMLDETGNTVLVGKVLKNSKGVEQRESIIPTFMSFKDLNDIKMRAMENAFVRNRRTGSMSKNTNQRTEANAFVHVIDNKIDALIDEVGLSKLGLAENSSKKLREAREFYKKTIGRTFKRRLGILLKAQSSDDVIETIESIPNEDLFQLFFTQKDKRRSAEMFRTMFSDIDDKGNVIAGTVNPEAKLLLLRAARRFATSDIGDVRGVKKLSPDIIESFFSSKKGPNLFAEMDSNKIDEFLNWKKAEEQFIDNSAYRNVFDDAVYADELDRAVKSLSDQRKDVLDNSIFGKIGKTKFEYEDIFIETEMFHAAEDTLAHFLRRAQNPNDDYTMVHYDALKRNIDSVDDIRAREVLQESSKLGPLSETVGPKRLEGASKPQNAIRLLIDAFENQPEKQKEVILALRGLFVKNIIKNAYKTTDVKGYKNTGIDEGQMPFKLVRDVDLASFYDIMNNEANLRMMEDLWNSGGPSIRDPEQIDRMLRILDLEVITKGKIPKVGTSFRPPTPLALNSLISRVYSISRGVVSPKYVASEIYITQAQIRKGNFLLKMITDPNVTITVEEAMMVASGKAKISSRFLSDFTKMATTLFLTQMGEEYSTTTEIKSPTWIKQQFIYQVELLKALSIRIETGLDIEQDVPVNSMEKNLLEHHLNSIPVETPKNTGR